MPYSFVFSSNALNWLADNGSATGLSWFIVGVLWSAVANVRSGYNTRIPRFLSPRNATGLVTSWIKCRSINNTSGPPSILCTTCASHTLSNNVLLIFIVVVVLLFAFCALLFAAQFSGDLLLHTK